MNSHYLALVIISLCWSSGCIENNADKTVQLETRSSNDSESNVSSNVSPPPKTPNYPEIFNVLVKAWAPDATDAEEEVVDVAYTKIEKFNEQEHHDFISFLTQKLQDSDPYVRLQAANEIANCRIQYLKEGKQNKDLVSTYAALLQVEEVLVRQFTLNSLQLFIEKSGLGEELSPLVQPLIQNLEQPSTAFKSMGLLGDIGAPASEAVPEIRKVAEREKDELVRQRSVEAIQKIESGEK